MNKWVHADPSVGSSGHGWRADTHRGGHGWQDGSPDHPAAGPTIPWCDASGDHDRADHSRKGHGQADKYDDAQANGRSPQHHDPEVSSDPSDDPGAYPGCDASTGLGGLTVLIGGFAAASGQLTVATGAVQSTAQDRAGVSIAGGEAVFDAYGYGEEPTELGFREFRFGFGRRPSLGALGNRLHGHRHPCLVAGAADRHRT